MRIDHLQTLLKPIPRAVAKANFWLSEFGDQYFINLISIPLKYPGSEDVLTIGFGGRAATYERADLLFYDLDFRMRLEWQIMDACT